MNSSEEYKECTECKGKRYLSITTGFACRFCRKNRKVSAIMCCRCERNFGKRPNFTTTVKCPICNGVGKVAWIDEFFRNM